ncbi:hypothetical protein NE237_030819 [Protea cynaroides]|uniref:Uncharacterized protein n=1 Tax=Protea cynaroides TaxID=273540 RepID=A0A9Q0JWE4_9MAGN|nr:hypothetical protein NE237_030819 [Protea cynaroides]
MREGCCEVSTSGEVIDWVGGSREGWLCKEAGAADFAHFWGRWAWCQDESRGEGVNNGAPVVGYTKDVALDKQHRSLGTQTYMAGRLRKDEADGCVEINCNGEGASFVVAETSSDLEDLGDFAPSMELKMLLPLVPHFHYTDDITFDPLLLLQDPNGPTPTIEDIDYQISPSLKTPQETTKSHVDPGNITVAMFKIARDQLNILKTKTNSGEEEEEEEEGEGGEPGNTISYSSYEVLTGHLWRISCEARGLADDQETKLHIFINGRSRMHPPLPSGYVGNVIFPVTPIALSGDLIDNTGTYAAGKIHDALIRVDDEYLRSTIDYLELNPAPTVSLAESPNILILSWV